VSESEKKLMDAGVRKPTVIIDWDGTCVPSAWPERPRKWLFGARVAIRHFLAMGYEVKVHTVRTHSSNFTFDGPNEDRDDDIAYIRDMLDGEGLYDVGIVLDDKPPAIFYIDDRAIRFEGNWGSVIEKVNEVHNAGEETKGDITDVAQEVAVK